MLEHVAVALVELARGGVEGDRHLAAGRVAGRTDRLHQHRQSCLVGFEVGRKATLVASGRGEPGPRQRALEVMEDLRAHAQGLREALGPDRDDHELLEVDVVVGVGTPVQHVHHRHGQHVGGLAAEVAPERLALLRRRGVHGGQRDSECRVGTQP